MTAEIAVYNKSAVALAADSAVTISNQFGLNKINNGAEKLFQLSLNHPVGLMVYGCGDLCKVPWELVIKSYRKERKNQSFPTLREWADDFFSYLQNSEQIISKSMKDEHIYKYLENDVFRKILETVAKELYPNEESIDKYYIKLNEYLLNVLESISNSDFFDDFVADDIDIAKHKITAFCNHLTNEMESEESGIIKSINQNLIDFFAALVCKKNDIGNPTGIVIAGYGDNEYYPQIITFQLHGFLDKKLRKYKIDNKCDSGMDGAGVIPFAQEDEVSAFMSGCSHDLMSYLDDIYNECFRDILNKISNIVKTEKFNKTNEDNLINLIRNLIIEKKQETDNNIAICIRENFIDRVVSMIDFLPKKDMAYMAESLVNLTAFKRKISDDSESVGGPIDVAVISKTDGFIWIKRKHYFTMELNNHFLSRNKS
ncbi:MULTISPECIES: hypothetical protein [unclassified Gilliamella]|uniref:hypothetical protein n=1 Tax=unclassified Gilliamella TaxID=2685620 RepID=UPI0018DCC60C|nr:MULTISPECIES: hypothetical protein [unclassified Gilliamella]MBI0114450.1 hypothetical protein [Gilliamella sp. W8123]MBI0118181.1 hypothetical protein [Gilliamella sp. W8129]